MVFDLLHVDESLFPLQCLQKTQPVPIGLILPVGTGCLSCPIASGYGNRKTTYADATAFVYGALISVCPLMPTESQLQ